MNYTLVALTLSGAWKSPHLAQKNSVQLRDLKVSRCFYSFAYNIRQLNIAHSSFSDFLDSAISFESVQRVYSGHYVGRPESPSLGDVIVVKDSLFENCKAKFDGGAISHFSPEEGSLAVMSTTFINCSSGFNPGDGGCIYFSGKYSIIDACCAHKCFAGRDGHSFCISLRGGKPYPNNCNRTTTVECAPREASCGWQSLYLGFGKIRITDYNSTKNTVTTQAGAFMMHTMDSDAMAIHVTVKECLGPWITYFFGKQGSLIQRSNFVANECVMKDSSGGLFHFHKYGRIENCFIAHHNGKLFKRNREGASVTVSHCEFDCLFDNEPGVVVEECKWDVLHAVTLELAHINTYICQAPRDVLKKPIAK